jgi:hypothetical protein
MPDLFVARISRPAKYTLGTTRWEQMFLVPFLSKILGFLRNSGFGTTIPARTLGERCA